MEELLARVAALIRRYTRLNTADVQHKLVFDGLVIDLDARCVLRNGEPVELLAKEYALLTTCAQHQGQILTKNRFMKQSGRRNMPTTTAILWLRSAGCAKN